MPDLPPSADSGPASPRFCGRCGARLPSTGGDYCESCGQRWFPRSRPDTIASLVQAIDEVQRWRREGLLDASSYEALLVSIEARRIRLRPPVARHAASVARAAPAPAASADAPPGVWPLPAPPRRSSGADLASWAAQRQADLLLYLGAFLLVVAAILFTDYRGDAVPPVLRALLLGGYTVTFIGSGLLLRRWERVREAGPVFLALGALLVPLNFVLAYVELLREERVPRDWVWLLGSATSMVLYGAFYFRGHGRGYRYLAGFAAMNAWESLFAVLELRLEWLAAWHMLLALLIASAATRARAFRGGLLASATGVAALSLFGAHGAAGLAGGVPAQLPVTYGLLTAGLIVTGLATRWPALLPAAASTATGAVVASMWAAGLEAVWLWYPAPLLGALTLATRRLWARRSEWLARFGWLFAAAWGTAPALAALSFDEPWHGVAVLGLGALVLAAVAVLDFESPLAVWLDASPPHQRTPLEERVAFAWVGYGLGLGSLVYANQGLELARPDTAWPYLGVATALAVALALRVRARPAATPSIVPPFLVSIALALQPWDRYPGHDAIVLGVAGVELLACAVIGRGWPLSVLGAALGAAALLAGWEERNWPAWTLALTYEVIGSILLVGTARWRVYRASADRGVLPLLAVFALPLSLLAAAFAVVLEALDRPSDRVRIFDTAEYRTLTGLVAAGALQCFYEAERLRRPSFTVPGGVVAGVALAMLWPALEWPAWTFALTYEAIAVALLVGTARWRVYRPASDAEGDRLVAVLVPLGGALGAALLAALLGVAGRLGDEGFFETPEYRTVTGLVAGGAAICLYEAWRIKIAKVTLPGGVFLGVALAMAWPALHLDRLWLPAAYEVVGTAVLLDRARRRARGGVAQVWAWGYVILALVVALGALPPGRPANLVVETAEYRLLVALVFLGAAQLGFEGMRRRDRLTTVAASAVAMLGVLMAIALAQPANVQAYTAPTAAYLFALGLAVGRRPVALLEDLYVHEAVLAAAVMVLVLPQAEQSFEPGGARWGFVLLIEGSAMLAAGVVLYERWLSVGGVLSISGVAVRWLIDTGRALPFWVTLGVVGFALLGLGVLLLFQREWWDRARASVALWWRGPPETAIEK